jgi:hypothetical protein
MVLNQNLRSPICCLRPTVYSTYPTVFSLSALKTAGFSAFFNGVLFPPRQERTRRMYTGKYQVSMPFYGIFEPFDIIMIPDGTAAKL